jgi:hypothetical protein
MFEGGESDDNTEMVAATGSSDPIIAWTALNPTQKFLLWTPDGEAQLGRVELYGQMEDEMWQQLCADNPVLNGRSCYGTYQWKVCS